MRLCEALWGFVRLSEGPMGLEAEATNKDGGAESKGAENLNSGGTVFKAQFNVEQMTKAEEASNPMGEYSNQTMYDGESCEGIRRGKYYEKHFLSLL